MEKVQVNGSIIYLLPVIYAFDEDENKIKNAVELLSPNCIAVGIPPEDVEFIGCDAKDDNAELSLQYEVYLAFLENFGNVTLPPRDIQRAHALTKERNIPFETIDVDDATYTDMLTENVSMMSLIRQSRRIKRVAKKGVRAETAESFVLEWDRIINGIPSFKKLEELREQHMARTLVTLCQKYTTILAIVPLERYKGVLFMLERYKKEPLISKA